MHRHHDTYTPQAGLTGQERVGLAELLGRYLDHRDAPTAPAVERLRDEIVVAAGIVR